MSKKHKVLFSPDVIAKQMAFMVKVFDLQLQALLPGVPANTTLLLATMAEREYVKHVRLEDSDHAMEIMVLALENVSVVRTVAYALNVMFDLVSTAIIEHKVGVSDTHLTPEAVFELLKKDKAFSKRYASALNVPEYAF